MIVLDCSAAIEMTLQTEVGKAFRGLAVVGEQTLAPIHFQAEAANSIWKFARAGIVDGDEAQKLLASALSLVDEFVPTSENVAESLSEAARLKHPVYDLLYLTLARRNSATLFTADKRLNSLCDELGVDHIHDIEF